MKMEFNTNQIPLIVEKIFEKILKTENDHAKVLALSGDLGAGKTTLTQEIAKELGVKENVVSPTFVIMKIYDINQKSKYYSYFKKLIHIDAYRIENTKELVLFGWKEIISNKNNLVVVEWPEKIKSVIPKYAMKVSLSHINEETRKINF